MRVQWDLTGRCNARCRHCSTFVRRAAAGRDLSTIEAKAILDNLAAMQLVDTVFFGGGEVTLRGDLVELVRHASRLGLSVWLTTNGYAVDEKLLVELMTRKLTAFCVSLDGATATTHDAVRGAGSFARASEALRAASREKSRRGTATRVQAVFTVMRSNIKEAEAAGELARSMGVDAVCYLHLVDPRRPEFDWAHECPSPEEILEVSERLAIWAASAGMFVSLPVPPRIIAAYRKRTGFDGTHTSFEERCAAGFHLCYIDLAGRAYPCHVAAEPASEYWPRDAAFDLREQEFRAVYFSPAFSRFMEAANDPARALRLREVCRTCGWRRARQCQPVCFASGACDGLAPRICAAALARDGQEPKHAGT